jgi:hypothetical protein
MDDIVEGNFCLVDSMGTLVFMQEQGVLIAFIE